MPLILIHGTGNPVGRNLTYGVVGRFGIELFTTRRVSMHLDAGGGFKSVSGGKANQYPIASSWLGSDFGIRTGTSSYR